MVMPASVTVRIPRALWGLLALASVPLATARTQQASDSARQWTIGSPAALVAEIQGTPSLIERLGSLGYVASHFRGGWVRFGTNSERVIGWSNAVGLKVRLVAGVGTTTDSAFSVGSALDDVARLEGTPGAFVPRADLGEAWLRYGRATVRVGLTDLRVRSWDDPGHALHARAPVLSARPAHPRPARPAALTATITFADEGDDGVLDAEERGTTAVSVRNAGAGTAYDVALTVVVAAGSGVRVVSASTADSIPPGREATLRAVVLASPAIADGSASLRVGVREANGFDLDPAQTVVVKTRALLAPRFVLDGIGVADQSGNGRIEPREMVDITARIANRGAGVAHNVRATIMPGPGVMLSPDSPADVTIGSLRPGESRDIRFATFANSRATGFPLSITVHETHARFDTTFALPLALDRPLAATPMLIVRGREPHAIDTPAALVVDVDTGVPRPVSRGHTVAVVLGVERYQRTLAAPFARHDAAVFREYAAGLLGIGDDPNRLFFRTDDEVTGGELHKVFDTGGWLSRRVTAETDVILYFAGHGVADLKTHAPFLLPNDADPNYPAQTGYALNELYERLAALGARSVTVFIDACFSGSTRDGTSLYAGARDVVVSVEHPALRSETMAVFTASSGAQFASVAPDRQHGLFTYWVLKGLRGDADADADHRISVGELGQYIRARVSDDAARQDREQQPEMVARNKLRTIVERQ
jgi:hypothetical protein